MKQGTIEASRDRQITRHIHKFFWKAIVRDKGDFFFWGLTRPPAMIIYNAVIPVEIAYGIQAIITGEFDEVWSHVWAIALLTGLFCLLWAAGGLAVIRAGVNKGIYVEKKAFTNFLRKDYEFFNDTYFGALGSQITNLRQAAIEYNQLLLLRLLNQLTIVIPAILIIAFKSILLAFITLVCMLLILSFTLWTGKWRLKYRRMLSEANSEVAGAVGDALSHGQTVKSFAAEEYEELRLDKSLKRWRSAQAWSWLTSIPADVGRALLAALTIGLLLLVTMHLYRSGTISIAIVALVQLYVIKMITATQEIAEIIKTYEAVMGSAYTPMKTMLVQPSVADQPLTEKIPPAKQGTIDFKNISFAYKNTHKPAVKSFSLHIEPGEKVGLVGYSGSGKTTLTKLLMRFMDVSKGSILLNGADIRTFAQRDLRKQIAYVPQEPLLFHRSILENIGYGKPSSTNKAITAAARAAYVHEFVADLPDGYRTYVGERGIKLSGGQRQRVAIARALLKDSPILVLDEATSALDSRSEKLIQEALWKLMKDRTALVIAHRLSTIQRLDRIIVMHKGKIVQVGNHAELKKAPGIYAELWRHQSGGYIGLPASVE